ncbi:MAG: FtsW/RodA/SpoVE family cell cycle protein [Planctomycetota bacterium]|nr:FtsW/RodA/SpoVE family cell cycle protein [Planctomycetota bacterium]
MSRFKRRPALPDGVVIPRERQLSLLERLDSLTQRVETVDPRGPAMSLFWCVLALMGIGLVLQANHAATTQPPDVFWAGLWSQLGFRVAAVVALIAGIRIGPTRLRRYVPALTVAAIVMLVLVYVPGFAASKNGARRWIAFPFIGFSFQPSELARIVVILWVADRCLKLGKTVEDLKRGVVPMLKVGLLCFVLILCETDLGGALLFLLCFLATMWVGGARPIHVYGPLFAAGGIAFLVVITFVGYIRQRIEMWLGSATNDQVLRSSEAIASGDLTGVGLGHGLFRNARVPYLESDYVFALTGEELGLVGMWLVLGLFIAFLWFALRYVLSIRDRYDALCAFGLLLSVGLQAMVHMQVVTGLAPPKGMPLPFLSHGGTSLVVSSLAVGVALGAAFRAGEFTGSSNTGAPSAAPDSALAKSSASLSHSRSRAGALADSQTKIES